MPSTGKQRLQFSLQSLFILTIACAWCILQWTVSERRSRVAEELRTYGYHVYRYDVLQRLDLNSLHWEAYHSNPGPTPMRLSPLGALIGWDNWVGITVIVAPGQIEHLQKNALSALKRLPGLKTVILWDANPETEKWPSVIDFRQKLRDHVPNVEVKHVHLRPFPVG